MELEGRTVDVQTGIVSHVDDVEHVRGHSCYRDRVWDPTTLATSQQRLLGMKILSVLTPVAARMRACTSHSSVYRHHQIRTG